MKMTIRCVVRGRVQGVFFRASTQSVARSLNIDGHAINLPDGSVEVLAHSDEKTLEQLKSYLSHGPDHARVDSLECEQVMDANMSFNGFTTG